MSNWLNKLAERLMLKARAEGKLQGLQGEGRPLPERPGDAFVDPGEAVGFRIMAEAGVIPEEITIQKEIAAQKKAMALLSDGDERKAAMAQLAALEMRLSMAKEARRKFLGS